MTRFVPFAASVAALCVGPPSNAQSQPSATPAQLQQGQQVDDRYGQRLGTVDKIEGDRVTVATTVTKIQLPRQVFFSNGSRAALGISPEQVRTLAKASVEALTAAAPQR